MKALDLIAVGELVKPQGIRGEFKAISLTDDIKRFGQIKRVYFNAVPEQRELFIQWFRPFKEFVLLKFIGVNDLSTAQELGRGLIYIPRQERPLLPPGRYYHDQILGLQVYQETVFLGSIVQIIETGSNDVYVVQDGQREILVPALQQIIRVIDLEARKMSVQLPPGLLEDED